MKKQIIECDICKVVSQKSFIEEKLPIIFHTEQNEGRSCEPYLEFLKLDVCANCYQKILKGYAIHAEGAQGYNSYYLNK
jgi:hypothetical protein